MSKASMKPKNAPGVRKTRKLKETRIEQPKSRYYQRFNWTQRVAHALLFTSFTTLGLTGLPQKYSLSSWGQLLINAFGGIETTRTIHHIAAVVLMLLSIYHLLDIGYKVFVLRTRLTMLPGIKDLKDALQSFSYNLGIAKKRPQMGRYTFEEKMEYWALLWGTVIMGITGFLMWNPIASTRLLPGEIIPASKAAHGGEALLAVAAIVLWHMYAVHIKHFNKSMFTGKMDEDEMLHDHPLELADIKAGISERPVDPIALRKRQMIYWPIAAALALLMLFGVYGFVGAEKTAVTTNSTGENSVPVYVPQTPTPLPPVTPDDGSGMLILTGDNSIASFANNKCAICHNPASVPDISLYTYRTFAQAGEKA